MDVVSEGELRRARAAGVPASKIIFAGVGKTRAEMEYALSEGILGFNVESEPELRALSEVASAMGLKAPVALRVNPDVDAKTHAKISTGKSENKFGIPFAAAPALYRLADELGGVNTVGIHMHIGSQIVDLGPMRDAFTLMAELARTLLSEGIALDHLDLGGGLGIPYEAGQPAPPSPRDYAAVVKECLGSLGLKVILEPGRMIAGNAGVLVSRVVHVKEGADRTFLIVDAAMNDLLRPTLYEAHHEIWPLREELHSMPPVVQDVVGPVCEDRRLSRARPFPAAVERGRSHCGDDGWSVRRGDVLDIQYATADPGDPGKGRGGGGGAAPAKPGRTDRA